MKRLALVVITLLAFACASYAQIGNVEKKEATKTLATFRVGNGGLMESNGIYFVSVPSTNQLDPPYLLYLGEGKVSARQTAVDIYKLFNSMKIKESADFTTMGGARSYTIYKANSAAISFLHTDAAGVISLSKLEMDKIIRALSK